MTDLCRNCCKIFCEYRDSLTECNNKVTFLQAGILDRPTVIKQQEKCGKSFKNSSKNVIRRK